MASVVDRDPAAVAEPSEKGSSRLSDVHGEKKDVASMDSSIESRQGDEALKLVGTERQVTFSDEYNLKLRRKLVCYYFALAFDRLIDQAS